MVHYINRYAFEKLHSKILRDKKYMSGKGSRYVFLTLQLALFYNIKSFQTMGFGCMHSLGFVGLSHFHFLYFLVLCYSTPRCRVFPLAYLIPFIVTCKSELIVGSYIFYLFLTTIWHSFTTHSNCSSRLPLTHKNLRNTYTCKSASIMKCSLAKVIM